MNVNKLVFRVHAIRRMFERHISEENVHEVLEKGEMIEEYENDTPYPSCLILGWAGFRPLHIVVAENRDAKEQIVITVYEPTSFQWEEGFKRRKK